MASARVDTPIGPVGLVASDDGLRFVRFDGERVEPEGSSLVLDEARRQLEAYFAGDLVDFDLATTASGTAFQQRVWAALREIPYGATVSYGELATAIGQPTAVRAVGLANGRNPISIVVPCHRVVGATGSLTGYGGGVERKRALLDLEARGAQLRSG
jgi:methylated-DNA-[protein]-cysteine S-methyltransferase